MAIKGKGKTKSKQVARAPRRGPVPVPVPFARRRWVQVVAAFVTGVLVVMFAVWVTNGTRKSRANDLAAQDSSNRRLAMQQWQSTVEGQIGTVGQIQSGQAPAIAPAVTAAVTALAAGKDSPATAADLKSAQTALKAAADALDTYKLADTVRDKGFGSDVETIFTSQIQLVAGLRGYQEAAHLALLALAAQGDTRQAIGQAAKSVVDASTPSIEQGWRQYQNALAFAGMTSVAVPPGAGTSNPLQP